MSSPAKGLPFSLRILLLMIVAGWAFGIAYVFLVGVPSAQEQLLSHPQYSDPSDNLPFLVLNASVFGAIYGAVIGGLAALGSLLIRGWVKSWKAELALLVPIIALGVAMTSGPAVQSFEWVRAIPALIVYAILCAAITGWALRRDSRRSAPDALPA